MPVMFGVSHITDPETLDAAIWLAGSIHWFEDGLNVESLYDQIITTLKGCFCYVFRLRNPSSMAKS